MPIGAYFNTKMTLDQFREVAEVGVEPGEPAVMPIHKLLQTQADEEA